MALQMQIRLVVFLLFILGKYCLVDVGYSNEYRYLGPYKGKRYRFQDFQHQGQQTSREESFNYAHSSLQNVIERVFGVWKKNEEFYRTCSHIHI